MTALLVVAAAGIGGGYLLGVRTHAPAVATGPAPAKPAERKVLYYRNPMGLPDTSPTPKKDPMGMDYIAVYEGEDAGASEPGGATQIRISTDKVQKLGVRTEAAALRPLGRSVRATGRVEPDERRISMISPKFEGYVERLHVNATGQFVGKGDALFEVYSPELVSAQREYAIAAQGLQAMKGAGGDALAGMKQLADASLVRLRNWDLPADEIDALVRTGEARRTVTMRSPVSGIVTEKKAFQGMRFMPGEALYQVTDLSAVWVVADVFERDLGLVKTGAKASVQLAAYPKQTFEGRITYVYPTLKAETRTVPVRVELANPRHLLKPAMFAQVEIQTGGSAQVLTVPDSAVIDSGTRRIVLVQRGQGRFEPREVTLGGRGENYVEVLDGVRAGEEVVVAANFLIDAESNLKAAIGGLGSHAAHGGSPSGAQQSGAAGSGAVGHKADGVVEGLDAKAGTVTLNHGPVPSLKWPAMTMEFKAANTALLDGLAPGQRVSFEFVERQPGEYVATSISPARTAPAASAAAGHGGHR
ncbi:MAG TPA: efflux RND transporter periplasmic adaptor subunit [Burkholderiaceae bacterium]|nr:efflux RND transporter periplasmic adaptor subunit [Burkholderiaceae bacterium]